jgi:hypothetical protein
MLLLERYFPLDGYSTAIAPKWQVVDKQAGWKVRI